MGIAGDTWRCELCGRTNANGEKYCTTGHIQRGKGDRFNLVEGWACCYVTGGGGSSSTPIIFNSGKRYCAAFPQGVPKKYFRIAFRIESPILGTMGFSLNYGRSCDVTQPATRIERKGRTMRTSECALCAHFFSSGTSNREQKPRCKAFPDGIPSGLGSTISHQHPYPGDHGIQFELHPDLMPGGEETQP
jgi:hypothetical protein